VSRILIGIVVGYSMIGMAAAASAPALSPVPSEHLISGTLTAIAGTILTIKTKSGIAKADISQAKQGQRIGVPLDVGLPVTVQGQMIEGNGSLLATAVTRAKPDPSMWPADR
jgi:hypothetical protein